MTHDALTGLCQIFVTHARVKGFCKEASLTSFVTHCIPSSIRGRSNSKPDK
jgi:hypothetical protein